MNAKFFDKEGKAKSLRVNGGDNLLFLLNMLKDGVGTDNVMNAIHSSAILKKFFRCANVLCVAPITCA